jgi:two-component system, sensor histidine kinase
VAAISRGTQLAAEDLRESLSQMLAEVWHDLNQTLYLTRMNLTPLLEAPGVRDSPELSERALRVRQSCETLSHLLAELLDLSRLESQAVSPRLKSMSLRSLAQTVVEHFAAKAEAAGVRIVVAAASHDCAVMADDLMLHRVVANLLDNAIAHSSPGATVLVALRYAAQCGRIQVRDAGAGISDAEQYRVFDAYSRGSIDDQGRAKGAGLGLAIVKRLVLLMNGSVHLRSAPNRGCCLSVRLPRAPRPGSATLEQ